MYKPGDIVRLARGKKPILVTASDKNKVAGRYLTSNEQGVWTQNQVIEYPAALSTKEQDNYTRIMKGLG